LRRLRGLDLELNQLGFAVPKKNEQWRIMIDLKGVTAEKLNSDWSGMGERKALEKAGWKALPVVRFGDNDYVILHSQPPHPGHNTAEVINVSELNDEHFGVVITKTGSQRHTLGNAWVMYLDEGGTLILVAHLPRNDVSPLQVRTAVLSYRVVEPTPADVRDVQNILNEELDNQ